MNKLYSLSLGIIFAVFCLPKHSCAQRIEGKDFWWAMPTNNTNTAGTANIIVQSNYYANVIVSFPNMSGANSSQTVSITPGTQSVVLLGGPTESVGTGSKNIFPAANWKVENVGVHITSDSAITVYAANHEDASMDAETVLPIEMLGTSYVVAGVSATWPGNEANFTVVGTQNSTSVTIKTWYAKSGTYQRDTTITITLNAGQTYKCGVKLNAGNNPAKLVNEVTGSIVTSNKPVAVISHTKCTGMVYCGACDMLMSQILPTSQWGTKYVTVQPIKRTKPTCGTAYTPNSGDWIEIIGKPGQQITFETTTGTYVKTIPALPFTTSNTTYSFLWYDNKPDPVITNPEAYGESNLIITSTQPFAVMQYQKDWETDLINTTDPESILS